MVISPSQAVPQISGVNMTTALSRLAGNAKLLLKLFGDFRKQNHDMVQQVQETLKTGDTETAQRLLHTLKGVAANLAMDALAEAAKAAEIALKEESTSSLAQAFDALQLKLDEVCNSIEQTLEPATPAPAPAPAAAAPELNMDEHSIRALTEAIRLAVRHSPDAAFVFETVRETLRRSYPQQADDIAANLDNFAFSAALKDLQQIAAELKLTV